MIRQLNKESRDLIKRWENGPDMKPKLTAYLDSGGVWTIGTGHTGKVDGVPVRKGMKITLEKAEELLDADTTIARKAVERLVKVAINDYQFGALTSWILNVGEGNAAKSTLIRKLNAGNYDAVPAELMKWVKDQDPKTGKLVTVKGLVNRRAAEAGLWARTSHVNSVINKPQKVATVAPSVATRDAATQVATGGFGAFAVGAEPVRAAVQTLGDQQSELSSGDWFRIAIALLIVAGTIYMIVRKIRSDA